MFFAKFGFDLRKRLWFEVERDHFLSDSQGIIVARAARFMLSATDGRWRPGLSGSQVRDHTWLVPEDLLISQLCINDKVGEKVLREIGFGFSSLEVAPPGTILRTYPHARVHRDASFLAVQRLRAAFRISGTRIRIGAASLEDAIRIHDAFVPHVAELAAMGDHSGGERLRIYRETTPHPDPVVLGSPERFYELAREQDFARHPGQARHWVRILPSGSVELRMFGVSRNLDEICAWISKIRSIAAEAG